MNSTQTATHAPPRIPPRTRGNAAFGGAMADAMRKARKTARNGNGTPTQGAQIVKDMTEAGDQRVMRALLALAASAGDGVQAKGMPSARQLEVIAGDCRRFLRARQ